MSQRVYSLIRLSWVTERTSEGFTWENGIRDAYEQGYQQDLMLPLPAAIPEGRDPMQEDLEQIGEEFGWKVLSMAGREPWHWLDLGGWQVDIRLPVERDGFSPGAFTIYDVPPRFVYHLARRLSRDCGPFLLLETEDGFGEPTVVEPHSIPEGFWTQDDGWEDLPELLSVSL